MTLQAFEQLDYPERLKRLLVSPQRTIRAELVITLDSGEIAAFQAYRVESWRKFQSLEDLCWLES